MLPTVEPGYMKPLLPSEAPQRPESWKDVMADIEKVIMPGVSTSYNMINDIFYIYIYTMYHWSRYKWYKTIA